MESCQPVLIYHAYRWFWKNVKGPATCQKDLGFEKCRTSGWSETMIVLWTNGSSLKAEALWLIHSRLTCGMIMLCACGMIQTFCDKHILPPFSFDWYIFIWHNDQGHHKCAYQSNKCNNFFLLVLQCFNWELLVTSAIYCHNPCQ